jgi:hypothetical protein
MTLQFDTVPQLLQQTHSADFHSAGALHAAAGAAYMMLNGVTTSTRFTGCWSPP